MLTPTIIDKLKAVVDKYKSVVPAPVPGNWKFKGDGGSLGVGAWSDCSRWKCSVW